MTQPDRISAPPSLAAAPSRQYGARLAVVITALVLIPGAGELVAEEEPAGPADQPAGVEEGTDSPEQEARAVPAGFVEMSVYLVAPTDVGNVVVLADAAESVMVPIFIGDTEALAIALRMDGDGFRRPLTHDLVDAVLRELGGRLVEVRIDSLEASTFVASLFIQQGEREFLLDSRASDSIALALGSDVPIYVSQRVIDEAGHSPNELGLPADSADPPTSAPQIPL